MKFIAQTTIADILPFFNTKLRDMENEVTRWDFHICNGCNISSLTAWNIYMTRDPKGDDCFPAISKLCIVFDNFLSSRSLNPLRASGLDTESKKMTKLESLQMEAKESGVRK